MLLALLARYLESIGPPDQLVEHSLGTWLQVFDLSQVLAFPPYGKKIATLAVMKLSLAA